MRDRKERFNIINDNNLIIINSVLNLLCNILHIDLL